MATVVKASKTERRGRPSEAESLEKRKGILSAATAILLSSGYREMSMRDVAERADVSTRTLYNLFADKASLFLACLDAISPDSAGPVLVRHETLEQTLREFAINMVRIMSRPEGLGFSRLVMIDGKDLPELASAGYANQERQFLKPLSDYMRTHSFDPLEAETLARLFISMAISEWNRSVTFHLPLPDDQQIVRHAERITAIFLHGVLGT